MSAAGSASEPPALLAITDLVVRYRLPRAKFFAPRRELEALGGVSLRIEPGRSLGIVGESGSGKSTLARCTMALERPSAGSVAWQGRDPNALAPAALRAARRDIQMVFQDPYGSLDPRQRVGAIVAEPLSRAERVDRSGTARRIDASLEAVGLQSSDAARRPHEFSGGQRQRIAIARALITRPKLIVADEPVSALDVSVQAQVLNLFVDLQRGFGITYLFISHDLAVIDHVCDAVAVLQDGRIVEQGPTEEVLQRPRHATTRALLAAAPDPLERV